MKKGNERDRERKGKERKNEMFEKCTTKGGHESEKERKTKEKEKMK